MTLSLTQAEAQAKLGQIQDARDQVVAKLKNIADTQQTMLSSAWRGGSATTYGNTSNQHQDDTNQIINHLHQIVETATTHINSVTNTDNG